MSYPATEEHAMHEIMEIIDICPRYSIGTRIYQYYSSHDHLQSEASFLIHWVEFVK